MSTSSLISPSQHERPRIFSKLNTSQIHSSSKNNSLSQPKLQLNFYQQTKTSQQAQNEHVRQNRPQSTSNLKQLSFELSPKNKSVQITLLRLQNRKEKQENEKMRQTVEKLKKELKDKVGMLQKFNDLMKIKYAEIKTLKGEIEVGNDKINELQEQNHQLEKQKDQLQQLNNQFQQQISELHQQQQQLQIQLQQQYQHQSQQQSQQQSQHQSSQQATQKIKSLYIAKSSQLDQLLSKLNNLEHQNFTNQIYQMKISKLYDQLDEEKGKTNSLLIQKSEFMQTVNQLKEKVELLQYENGKIVTVDKFNYQSERIEELFVELNQIPLTYSPTKQSKQSQHLNAFQQALKVQLKHIQQLKKTIQNSQQIIQSLKDNLITSRRELEQLRSEMKIMNLKQTTERKKLIMEYRLQLHEKDNQINDLSKKYKTLDDKFKAALNDIKAKDDFLRQHLLGRLTDISAQQYVDSVLKKYTQNFQQLIDLKTQNSQLIQKSQQYLKYEQQIQNVLVEYKKSQ